MNCRSNSPSAPARVQWKKPSWVSRKELGLPKCWSWAVPLHRTWNNCTCTSPGPGQCRSDLDGSLDPLRSSWILSSTEPLKSKLQWGGWISEREEQLPKAVFQLLKKLSKQTSLKCAIHADVRTVTNKKTSNIKTPQPTPNLLAFLDN